MFRGIHPMPRYIIYGAGAIGSILGARLYQAGCEVLLIARQSQVEAIQKGGLEIHHRGEVDRLHLPAAASPFGFQPGAEDRILVTLKAQQTAEEVDRMAKAFPSETPVVSFQNAVHNEEILARHFSRVYGGLIDFSGTFLKPGVVYYTRNNFLALGNYPSGSDRLVESMAADLERAGFQVDRPADIMALKWWKLIINANNALLAILDCWVQKAHSDPAIYPLVADVLEESFDVLSRTGIRIQPPAGVPGIPEMISRMRCGAMAVEYDTPFEKRTYPSTWQDLFLQRGENEGALFNGEIVRLARERGIPAPLNDFLLVTLEEMTRRKEKPGKYSPAEMKVFFMERMKKV
jgi:2-dehydropantoate 2-reductase